MEKSHPISDLMSTTMQKIREMVDVNTIVGTPIHTADGVTLIPVSRLSFGFASGGSDFATKSQKPDADNSFGVQERLIMIIAVSWRWCAF